MKKLMFTAVFAVALAFAGCASSGSNVEGDETAAAETTEQTETAEQAEEFEVFSWEQTKDAMTNGGVLIDARGADAYAEGHIEGAVNASYKDDAAMKAALPENKDTWLVFYCGGPQCAASNKAAQKAKEWGYTMIAEYKGGYPEWKELNTAAE